MKKLSILLLACLTCTFLVQAQNLQPYTIGAETTGTVSEVKNKVRNALSENGIEVVGEYTPAGDANRLVPAITSPDLSMGTFMKIVSTPKDIKRLLETATK